ncbi:hypothetical protein SPHFLASMR4Y_02176 [Sphingorhabdus sp. SMR4y]|nr:hypothetical protein SPHFLASMR4Y_02176 [Sphingorhabdus sp. SMR4y]
MGDDIHSLAQEAMKKGPEVSSQPPLIFSAQAERQGLEAHAAHAAAHAAHVGHAAAASFVF